MAINDSTDRYYFGAGDIFGVLRALQIERSTVNVQFENGAQLYNTMVLDANLKDRYFLLDEVTPRDGHRKVDEGTTFSLRASINGIKVHAKDLKSSRTLSNESGIYYVIPFPAKLLYLQRRDAFRAYVPGSMMAVAEYRSAEREDMPHGRIMNMSATGIRVAFPGGIKPELQAKERFEAVIKIQAQEQNLECQIEIVYYEYSRDRDLTICGCRFVDLHRNTQMIINRLVTFLQRESMA
ncbi:MAG: flagellar brake protein [Gammaproteobacteria bacterium]|nr:flagellar brake protein [Gammaproteobacteria bacterium]MDP2139350.1 flagellar brake protein [Gammaproteobacteria bacterium]MDP2347265.1 flagellar brake protein [Gammaproteobacteria bacterium]